MKLLSLLDLLVPKKSNIVKDAGTNVSRPAMQFKWTTKLGNEIKLHFDNQGNDAYTVIFYVNDTLFDDAAKSETGRDPEILSGILYLLKDRSDRIGAKSLNFTGHKSDGDTKLVRGISPEEPKKEALFHLNQFDQAVNQHQVQMIPPSETKLKLWKRLSRDVPTPTPDFNQNRYRKLVDSFGTAVRNNQRIYSLINELKSSEMRDFDTIGYDIRPLIASLTQYENAISSNSPEGWKKTKNRRTAIYTRLVNKHMSSDWDIEIEGDRFELTRKVKEAYS